MPISHAVAKTDASVGIELGSHACPADLTCPLVVGTDVRTKAQKIKEAEASEELASDATIEIFNATDVSLTSPEIKSITTIGKEDDKVESSVAAPPTTATSPLSKSAVKKAAKKEAALAKQAKEVAELDLLLRDHTAMIKECGEEEPTRIKQKASARKGKPSIELEGNVHVAEPITIKSMVKKQQEAEKDSGMVKIALTRHNLGTDIELFEMRSEKLIVDFTARLQALADELVYERKAKLGSLCEISDWSNLNSTTHELVLSLAELRSLDTVSEEKTAAIRHAKVACDILFKVNMRVWDSVFMEQAKNVVENALARVKVLLDGSRKHIIANVLTTPADLTLVTAVLTRPAKADYKDEIVIESPPVDVVVVSKSSAKRKKKTKSKRKN